MAFGIFWEGLQKILAFFRGEMLPVPGSIALIAAILSIALKEWLYCYTMVYGRELKSDALITNA
ncbi:MAG TPA: hypothetical protein VN278_04330 [Methanosarcina sp.]|nr:hypothetical protein [Methanosarcina sp.]